MSPRPEQTGLCKAEQDIARPDIALWTIDTFGPRQAQAYEEDLIGLCSGIAAAMLQHKAVGRSSTPI